MKGNNIYFVDEWEANGYDDSDGDVVTYNGNTKEIEHHFWTTRCYCPCSYNEGMTDNLEDGIKNGLIKEEDVRQAIIKDIFGEKDTLQGLPISELPSEMVVNVPCKVMSRGKVKYEGILIKVIRERYLNYFGYDCVKSYGYVFNPKDKSLNKTLLHNVERNIGDELGKNLFYKFVNESSLGKLCGLFSAKGAQFSGPYYYCTYISKNLYPIISDDFTKMVEIDNTDKKSGMTIKSEKRKAEKVNNKYISIKKWADTLEDKSEDEKKLIIKRTLNKYYGDDILKGYDYLNEEVKNVLAA